MHRQAPSALNDAMHAHRGNGFAGARLLLFASTLFLSMSAAWAELAGSAIVISGDTIEVQGRRVRLYAVTAPGLDQLCVSAQAQWRCGMVAKLKLEQRIGSTAVSCREQGADRHGRTLGRCRVDDAQATDLNRWLVAGGWALASGDHGQEYMEAEKRAMTSSAGLWRDGFVPSDDWRRIAQSAEREPGDGAFDCSRCTLRHRALGRRGADEKPDSVTQ
jgi:endonuclease YncB( thermonuclease family)